MPFEIAAHPIKPPFSLRANKFEPCDTKLCCFVGLVPARPNLIYRDVVIVDFINDLKFVSMLRRGSAATHRAYGILDPSKFKFVKRQISIPQASVVYRRDYPLEYQNAATLPSRATGAKKIALLDTA